MSSGATPRDRFRPNSWNDAAGAVLSAVFAAPAGDGVDRVAIAINRSRDDAELILPEPREGMAWRSLVDTAYPDAPERPLAIADRQRLPARSCLVFGESLAPAGPRSGPPTAKTIDALSTAVGVSAEWWNVFGKRTIVSPETKIVLLAALGLDAGSEARARESLTQIIDETQRRRAPLSLVLRSDEPLRRAASRRATGLRGAHRMRGRPDASNGARRRGTAWRRRSPTDGRSRSAKFRCPPCRSAGTG